MCTATKFELYMTALPHDPADQNRQLESYASYYHEGAAAIVTVFSAFHLSKSV